MKYFYIEPEVAGNWGENTVVNQSVSPPIVTNLHYHFDGWLGDVLLETFPCFIVTALAKQRIEAAGLTGATFAPVEPTTSELFQELYPNRQLPEFAWLKVDGVAGADDFGPVPNARLVVSEGALALLRELGISQASISEFAVHVADSGPAMRYYMLEPEVAGGLGQKAVLDHSVSLPALRDFTMNLTDGWAIRCWRL
jgi:hypothetical protein